MESDTSPVKATVIDLDPDDVTGDTQRSTTEAPPTKLAKPARSRILPAVVAALVIGNLGAVSDLMLAQARAPTEPSGPSAQSLDPRNDSVIVDDTALGGNSGLVQINLIGGERNSSANTFALNVSAGGNP